MARTTDQTKMAAVFGLLLLLSAALSSVDGQSFQYSRGWTNNGKRSDGAVSDLQQRLGAAPSMPPASSARNTASSASSLLTRPCSALYPHPCPTPLRMQQGLDERVAVLESRLFDLVAVLASTSPLTDYTDFLAKHKLAHPDYFSDN